jgi:DUF1707 SHOCT-like domain
MVTPTPGHGRLRVSHADREQVVDLLKAAFVQGRLTPDELDGRIGQVLAARTYADLTALTADLPAEPERAPIAAPVPVPAQAGTRNQSAKKAVKSGAVAIGAAVVVLCGTVAALGQPAAAILVAIFMTVLAGVAAALVSALIAVSLKVESRRRTRRQLPPGTASGAGGQAAPSPSSADPAGRPRPRSPGSLAVGPAS